MIIVHGKSPVQTGSSATDLRPVVPGFFGSLRIRLSRIFLSPIFLSAILLSSVLLHGSRKFEELTEKWGDRKMNGRTQPRFLDFLCALVAVIFSHVG